MTEETITIHTTRFGEVTVPRGDLITFPEGLIGFAQVKEYVILPNPSGGPFQWLQAASIPDLAFVVCDPRLFKPDYKVLVRKEDLAAIKIESVDDGAVVVIVVIPRGRSFQEMTANLRGPIVINLLERLAKQLVLSGDEYELKYPVFGAESAGSAG